MERTYPPNLRAGPVRLQKCAPGPKECQELLFANCDQDVSCEDAWRRGTNGAGGESFPRTLPQSSYATVATRRRGTQSFALQRPQARPTSILTQGRRRYKEACRRPLYPVLAGALYHFSMRRTSVRLSRCSWPGASSSIFHRAACASPLGFVLLKEHVSVT
jgi:hypothetical protein